METPGSWQCSQGFYRDKENWRLKWHQSRIYVLIHYHNVVCQEIFSKNESYSVMIPNTIRELKDAHNRPVIALYGWPDDPHFPEKIKQARANFCFKMPYKLKDFEKAVRASFRVAPFDNVIAFHR